jgi:hypothetical protein
MFHVEQREKPRNHGDAEKKKKETIEKVSVFPVAPWLRGFS